MISRKSETKYYNKIILLCINKINIYYVVNYTSTVITSVCGIDAVDEVDVMLLSVL